MSEMNVRFEVADEELLDLSEDVGRLIENSNDLAPASRGLLLALDEALTKALATVLRLPPAPT